MSDKFNKTTKEKLAHQAGYRCSKPGCGIPTRGATFDARGTINVGEAAHITAAAPGASRFDSTLTSDQRKRHSNGIWLCATHAKLVDSDESHFTVEELYSWKRLAQRRSFQEVVSSKSSPVGALLADGEDVQTAVDLLLGYSKSDLLTFQNMPGWPAHAVALNLKMVDESNTQVFAVSGLAQATELFDEVVVVAPPGTGKTTTLLQLADAILDNASSVAVFVPLSEWSTRSDTFFQLLVRRGAFRDATERQFELLADHGRLVLILDGWNELDETSKRRVRNDLKSLRRDFPTIRLVVSSRHKDANIPIDGPVVEVDILTEEQQLEIAKALRGSEGESLMDHAWRTPGLRELVAIPLYLTALLKQAPGDSLPTTKEEVLRLFVAELERDADKAATLREALQGFHRDYLEAIAVETTRQDSVVLSEEQIRAVINTVKERLLDGGQIAQLLQPMKVVDLLVDAHMLVRFGAESGGVSFQHQQFQEWFASFWVQQLMLSAASGDEGAEKKLLEDVLNIPVWEEAILFTCDRLSRTDQSGTQAVAHAILETLGIDPLLSAEMIWRSSSEVWEQARESVMSFVAEWHTEGRIDRAVRFMIDTGRAEFSQYVWPLISDSDDQVHLHALRAGRKFRPSVLGPDVQERIAALPAEVRENVLSEIASNGDMDGIELATTLAKNDASSEVKISIIESLVFRRADRFATEILETASDEVWCALAKKWHPNDFADPDVSARMEKEAAELLSTETDFSRILSTLLRPSNRDTETGPKVQELVEKIDFSEKTQDNMWLVHRAHELYPEEVVGALVSLLEHGKPVPFGTDEMLRVSKVVIDDGPIADRVLQHSGEGRKADAAVSIVGPATVGKLIDRTFAVYARRRANCGRFDKALRDEYHTLLDCISGTKTEVFIQAILERGDTEQPEEISILADLMSRHGSSVEGGPLGFDSAVHERATATVQRWANILLASPDATREQFADIARVAERLESPALVPVLRELLSEELTRRKRALEEMADARIKGIHIENDALVCYTLQYRRAFAAIGDEQTIRLMKDYLPHPDFGIDAAQVLESVWMKSQHAEDEGAILRSWPDFSVVPENHSQRQSGAGGETHTFVNEILAVVDDLIKPGTEDAGYKHALRLSVVAFSMPYNDKADTIASLLELPVRAADKRDLLTVLVLSGEAISSEIVVSGIDELLEEAKTNPWLLDDREGWRLRKWLRLLPFTGRPASILDVLDRVEDFQIEPWNLRDLLSALSYTPSAEAETILAELAKRNARFLSDYHWIAALTRRNTLTAGSLFLDLICNEPFSETRVRLESMDFGRQVSIFIVSNDQFRRDVYDRYPGLTNDPVKSVLEHAIAEAADVEGVMLLVREGAARGDRLGETVLHTALRQLLVGEIPTESSGMQQVYSLPAPELRKALFAMVVSGNAEESRLATECLNAIDKIRDDYGHVDAEPRHPDIATGVPWPRIDITEPL